MGTLTRNILTITFFADKKNYWEMRCICSGAPLKSAEYRNLKIKLLGWLEFNLSYGNLVPEQLFEKPLSRLPLIAKKIVGFEVGHMDLKVKKKTHNRQFVYKDLSGGKMLFSQ